jgi:hypothetical protein
LAAAQAQAQGELPTGIGEAINEGVAEGFNLGVVLAVFGLIIVLWS